MQKLVKEHINFERGKDPIKAMKIGNDVANEKWYRSIEWDGVFNIDELLSVNKIIKIFKYQGYTIAILKYIGRTEFKRLYHIWIFPYNKNNKWAISEKEAVNKAKSLVDDDIRYLEKFKGEY